MQLHYNPTDSTNQKQTDNWLEQYQNSRKRHTSPLITQKPYLNHLTSMHILEMYT